MLRDTILHKRGTMSSPQPIVKLSPREAALITLGALENRGQRRGKELTRARLSAATLKALWNRETLTPQWIEEVNEWLVSAGWILIFVRSTYAAIKVSVVENWPRVASRHLNSEIEKIKRGSQVFEKWAHLLRPQTATSVVSNRRHRRNSKKKNDAVKLKPISSGDM